MISSEGKQISGFPRTRKDLVGGVKQKDYLGNLGKFRKFIYTKVCNDLPYIYIVN